MKKILLIIPFCLSLLIVKAQNDAGYTVTSDAGLGLSNSITTTLVGNNKLCPGASASVSYTISGLFNSGNVFTAQLSSSTGSFASPVNIGSVSSTSAGSISVTIPGNTTPPGAGYFIRVVSSNPSVTGSTVGLTIAAIPTCGFSGNTSYCVGSSTQLCESNTTNITGYLWSSTQTSQCITIASAGTYTVTITNNDGCTNTCSQAITQNSLPDCQISGPSSVCNTSAHLCAPSNLSSYTWSSGALTQCFDATATGTYTVTVIDGNGCSSHCNTFVAVNPGADVDPGPNFTLDCHTIAVQLNASSNTLNAQFSWIASNGGHIVSGGNTSSPWVDQPGNYDVTVTNPIGGCTATSTVTVGVAEVFDCSFCNKTTITPAHNITIDFNVNPPAYIGDPALQPFFSYDNSGPTPDTWVARFDLGGDGLVIPNGVTIKTTKVHGYAPGFDFEGCCDFKLCKGGHIVVASEGHNAGDIFINFRGDITVDGEIRNETTGDGGIPGSITLNSECHDINVGKTGLVQAIGEDWGGNCVTLSTCGSDCNFYGSGNIKVCGLVKSYAEASHGNPSLNRPIVKVISYNGSVTIDVNSVEPIYDEFVEHGVKFDIYGGLLSWTDRNTKPGSVYVQARKDISVNGHGTDPTGPVRRSFGAIAAVGTASATQGGGTIDVRSIEGNIIGMNRSFDVSGKNVIASDRSLINLYSKWNVALSRPGANNNFNPVVDARSPVAGGKGGINDLISFSGQVIINSHVQVLASVPAGGGSVQGINKLTSCAGIINNGTVTPHPSTNTNCGTVAPPPIFTECFGIHIKTKGCITVEQGGTFKSRAESTENLSHELNVYPNPNNGKITLQFNSQVADKYTVRVISIEGSVLLTDVIDATEGMNSRDIDLSRIAKGIYILELEGLNVKEIKRIVIQ